MSEEREVVEIRERWSKASPYPGAWGIVDPDRDPVEMYREHLAFGSGPIHTVWLPTHPLTAGEHPRPEHAVLLCITGNGPTSEANAQFLAGAWEDIGRLLSQLTALRAERDALVKRVAALEIAVVRACVPLEAFWADEGSRRYVAPSLRPLFEDAIAIGRAALAAPAVADTTAPQRAEGER